VGDLGERDAFFRGVAGEIEAFLLRLEASPDDLFHYVKNRVAFLNTVPESELSDTAKALLLESNYSVVQEVMKHRESQALRWVCVWVI
jgi:hypothetical protein